MYCKYNLKDGEACSKIATEDGKFCAYHAERNTIDNFHEKRNETIRKNWNIVMEEIQIQKPKTSLAQIFEYLEYLCSADRTYFSRDFLIDWYYKNLASEGHPVEIVKDKDLTTYFHRYSYKKILEEGFPKSVKEVIEEFLIKNSSATAKEISFQTKIEIKEIYAFAKEYNFPISKRRDNQVEVSAELKKNPQITEEEIMSKLNLDKFEINRVKEDLDIEFAKEKIITTFQSDGDENRIRKNLSFLYAILSNLRDTKLLNANQEELLIGLFRNDGDISQTAKFFGTENKSIIDRLKTISKQSSKLRDILEIIKLGNSIFTNNSTDYVSEVHEPSLNELHDGPLYEVKEEIEYNSVITFIRTIDLAKMAKFISFDYLRKYGYP